VRLRAAHAAVIRDQIRPAYVRLRDFLKNEYLPARATAWASFT
jgi:uncharacterized protein (DUF885 family)